jgi:hypothetical protein
MQTDGAEQLFDAGRIDEGQFATLKPSSPGLCRKRDDELPVPPKRACQHLPFCNGSVAATNAGDRHRLAALTSFVIEAEIFRHCGRFDEAIVPSDPA